MLVYNHVKKMRAERNVTQERLAWEVGVSRQTIVAIEKGNYIPSLKLGMQLADFFNIPIEKLFFIK